MNEVLGNLGQEKDRGYYIPALSLVPLAYSRALLLPPASPGRSSRSLLNFLIARRLILRRESNLRATELKVAVVVVVAVAEEETVIPMAIPIAIEEETVISIIVEEGIIPVEPTIPAKLQSALLVSEVAGVGELLCPRQALLLLPEISKEFS